MPSFFALIILALLGIYQLHQSYWAQKGQFLLGEIDYWCYPTYSKTLFSNDFFGIVSFFVIALRNNRACDSYSLVLWLFLLLCSDLSTAVANNILHSLHLYSLNGFLPLLRGLCSGFPATSTRSCASFSSSDNLEYIYFLHINLCLLRDPLCAVLYAHCPQWSSLQSTSIGSFCLSVRVSVFLTIPMEITASFNIIHFAYIRFYYHHWGLVLYL